jgi:predicted metal-binding protein
MVEADSIEYEIVNWEKREVWKCQASCKRYRHRRAMKDLLPAICCGQPAKLMDRYEQPTPLMVSEPLASQSAGS